MWTEQCLLASNCGELKKLATDPDTDVEAATKMVMEKKDICAEVHSQYVVEGFDP